jgi:transcriptional regulator with XRE-family HTH domain
LRSRAARSSRLRDIVRSLTENPWQEQVEAFGRFIHTQRKLAQLSLRELSEQTEISNAYHSQLERGLHAPSVRVMKALADAFDLSVETLLEQTGLADEQKTPDTEAAIKADPALTPSQKEALLGVYRGFVESRDQPTSKGAE